MRDEVGNVVGTGRSSDLAARAVAHANDPVLGQFEFQVEHRTEVYAEQRGLEQMLYDQYPGATGGQRRLHHDPGDQPAEPERPWLCRQQTITSRLSWLAAADGEGQVPRGRLVRGAFA